MKRHREPERLVDEAGVAGRHVAAARAVFDAAAEGRRTIAPRRAAGWP